jgi:ADP-ribosylglycohydrolase
MTKLNKDVMKRFRGSFIGLAVGDALGVPLEFQSPGTFEPVTDMIGGGKFDLELGEWTDDTSTALCLAQSLIEMKGFNPEDQLNRYLRWYHEGYLSVNGSCFDIGNTTREALMRYEETGEPFSGPDHERSAGNGSLMRLAPVPLFYFQNPSLAIELSGDSSRTTHQHPLAIDACKYTAGLIVGALNGESKETILSRRYCPIPRYWDENILEIEVDEIACGSYKNRNPPEINGKGFVVRSLEAALWAFYNTDSFEEGCLSAVNLGDDADTVGAIYGQIAGAYYGESGISERWIDKLAKYDMISCIVDELLMISSKI